MVYLHPVLLNFDNCDHETKAKINLFSLLTRSKALKTLDAEKIVRWSKFGFLGEMTCRVLRRGHYLDHYSRLFL